MATVDASAFNRLNVSYMRAISVFHVAAAYGPLDQIPRALVNRRNMEAHLRATGETIFHTAAQCDFKGVPSELMLEKNMQIPNSLGATVFHIAAAKGVLNHMPVGFLTESNMLKPDWEGSSVFHVAAQNGHIDQIPKELLTEQNMLRSDSNGDTVLHGLALRGELRKLPVSLLTERTLLASNAGATVLHVALKHDKLDQLLGLELPDKARNILGDAWYSANLAAVALKNPSSQEHAIDLF